MSEPAPTHHWIITLQNSSGRVGTFAGRSALAPGTTEAAAFDLVQRIVEEDEELTGVVLFYRLVPLEVPR